ncbi:hypothetical protein [Streptomyces sp. NPDC051572]|uniref:hypothetical protein n=1 Tax=Streptomyces sp. NPDC051572 TaxID=3155802 RepID=UPI00344FE0D4
MPSEPGVDLGEYDDEPEAEPGETQPKRLPIVVIPDLRPYADPKAVVDLARRGAKASRAPVRNAARRVGAILARTVRRALAELALTTGKVLPGSVLLVGLLVGWLNGTYGKKGSIPARFGGAIVALAALAHTIAPSPTQGALVLVWAWCMAAIMAGISAERGAFDALLKKARGKQQKAPADDIEKVPAPRRTGLAAWLRRKPAPVPDNTPAAAPDEESAPDPVEDVQEHPLTALIRELIGTDNGVHLQVLRPAMRERFPALSGATDQQLRKVLLDADWNPSRTFRAGGIPGRAGIHRDQLPPLPSPGDGGKALSGPHSSPKSAGQKGRRRAAESKAKRAGDKSQAIPEEWTREDVERGYRWVNDVERGPSAWTIDHLRDE